MEKMTNKVALQFVLGLEEVIANKEVFEKVSKMLEQVEKKSASATGSNKPTKTQKENIALKSLISEIVETPMQAKEVAEVMEVSVQKASALLNQMVKEGRLEKAIEKKITRFQPVGYVEVETVEVEISEDLTDLIEEME